MKRNYNTHTVVRNWCNNSFSLIQLMLLIDASEPSHWSVDIFGWIKSNIPLNAHNDGQDNSWIDMKEFWILCHAVILRSSGISGVCFVNLLWKWKICRQRSHGHGVNAINCYAHIISKSALGLPSPYDLKQLQNLKIMFSTSVLGALSIIMRYVWQCSEEKYYTIFTTY